ncbi:hypothetical protein [Paraburkholderia sp. SIMBA_030]|uniref:hypothetical protein n=1 Tax=Paraburkholderia sp. SIMBA_030 TaxID=3085773 RepID=UPI00397B56C1
MEEGAAAPFFIAVCCCGFGMAGAAAMHAANLRVRGNCAPISSDILFLFGYDALFFAASASTSSFFGISKLLSILYECTVLGVVSPRVQARSDFPDARANTHD